jgi:4-diphosphocytidyl-2-C-methyl-D-erythritol kinase
VIRARAYAKVTLSLRVTGRRDDGYHDLEALAVSATEPHDELTFRPASTTTMRVTGPFAGGVPTDASNLVVRALRAVGATMTVELTKGIPAAAGLGGGSADAAVALGAFGGSAEHAAALGSDVTFSLQARPARMRGRGDFVEPMPGLDPLELLILAPDFGCSTPAVYRAWDELGGVRSERLIDAPAGYPGPFVNDLEPAAERVEPRLGPFRRALEDVLQRPVLLCGSGSAYAAWFPDAEERDAAARRASAVTDGNRIWRARTLHE